MKTCALFCSLMRTGTSFTNIQKCHFTDNGTSLFSKSPPAPPPPWSWSQWRSAAAASPAAAAAQCHHRCQKFCCGFCLYIGITVISHHSIVVLLRQFVIAYIAILGPIRITYELCKAVIPCWKASEKYIILCVIPTSNTKMCTFFQWSYCHGKTKHSKSKYT